MFCLLVIASEIFLLCISYIPGCNDLSWENLDNGFFPIWMSSWAMKHMA